MKRGITLDKLYLGRVDKRHTEKNICTYIWKILMYICTSRKIRSHSSVTCIRCRMKKVSQRESSGKESLHLID